MRKQLQIWMGAVLGAVTLLGGARTVQAAAAARVVFKGGPIYTADPAAPTAEAVAVGDGKILYVGTADGAAPFIDKKTRVIDLKGQALYPGFVDADFRLQEYAEAQHEINLAGLKGYDELVRRVAQTVRKTSLPTDWIIGRGWNQNEWTGKDPIRMSNLQEVCGTHPVILFHQVDDAMIASSSVLENAGAIDDPPDPPGGRFIRTRGGMPTGVLLDAAEGFVLPVMPSPSAAELVSLYREAADSCAVHGFTSVHAMKLSSDGVAALDKVAKSKEGLPVRVYGAFADSEAGAFKGLETMKRKIDPASLFTIKSVMLLVDGGLDTRGAALSRPYEDEDHYSGHFVFPQEGFEKEIEAIVAAGYQPVFRATGDAAVKATLDALAAAAGDSTGATPVDGLPPRIESAAVMSPDDVARFHSMGVIASVQPGRVAADYSWIEDRLGLERKVIMHPWKTLKNAGVPVMISTGAPAGPLDPVFVFYAAVTRQNAAGRPSSGWRAEERLSRQDALEGMTRTPAISVGEGDVAGTIAVGKRADLTVLSKDIMQVPDREILSARATLTMVGGKIVHEKMSNP